MYNGATISLKSILWKVFTRPVTQGLNYEDAAEYAIEAIRLIGAPLMYVDKVTSPPLKIVNYKAALPECIINIRGVKLLTDSGGGGVALRRATDLYHQSIRTNDSGSSVGGTVGSNTNLPISPFAVGQEGVNYGVTGATGTTSNSTNNYVEFTYTAQNGVIQTSFKEGEVEVAYKSLAVDKEGYPLIPDNQKVKLAIEYYILYRFLEPLWEMGKITDKVFNRVEQEKFWYISSANTDMQLQSGDHLESVMNSVNRLIVNDSAFKDFYKGAGNKEIIKKFS